jgi:hypothetical protein
VPFNRLKPPTGNTEKTTAGNPAAADEVPDPHSATTPVTIHYGGPDPAGPWSLYVFGADGLHSGRQWFAMNIRWPDDEIGIAEAKERAEEAIAQGHEVRIYDADDMLLFQSADGKTLHGEGFWGTIPTGKAN